MHRQLKNVPSQQQVSNESLRANRAKGHRLHSVRLNKTRASKEEEWKKVRFEEIH